MAYVTIPGASPLLVPFFGEGLVIGSPSVVQSDSATLDADEEEYQIIGAVHIEGGGSKTFGTSGSKISWLPGASITFQSSATLRVGVKKASQISTSAGPPVRATIGAAAFDVYKDLVGGTDTIASTTWRDDSMASGTPFSVVDGDLIAIAFHLDIVSAAQSIKIRQAANVDIAAYLFPGFTLVTSGPVYAALAQVNNTLLTFDDGTLGWIDPIHLFSVIDVAAGPIGNTNIWGNVINLPFSCKIDALYAQVNSLTAAADFSLCLYQTPFGTPTLVEAMTLDGNALAANNVYRSVTRNFTTKRELLKNTNYVIGIRQDSGNGVNVFQFDVSNTAHHVANGLGSGVYAVQSTAGAAFASVVSGVRRYNISARISDIEIGPFIIARRDNSLMLR